VKDIAVVGGSLAGSRVAETLRREGYSGRLSGCAQASARGRAEMMASMIEWLRVA
jgi:flavin-dependent dehydrogenase